MAVADSVAEAQGQSGQWVPIVPAGSELAQQIESALDEIALALTPVEGEGGGAGYQPAAGVASPSPPSARHTSLADGPAGWALFFHYLDQVRPDRGYAEMALTHLETAIAATAESATSPGLYGGFSGVAWVLEHLTGRLLDAPAPGEEDPGADVAQALVDYLGHTPWLDEFDVISGLAGFGVWAIERGDRPGGREAAARIIRRLSETKEEHEGGITWRTPPVRLLASEAELYPEGYLNTGVAHGVPGVIGILGAMHARGLTGEEGDALLDGAVRWILAHALPPGLPSRYPYSFAPNVDPNPARLAWCYGDPGVATCMLLAARAAGNAAWEREALAIGHHAAARPRGAGGVTDGSLCHGAAGLVVLFNRLYQATRDPLWRDETLYWVQRLFDLRVPGDGVAGWRSWRPLSEVIEPTPVLGWTADPGFLTGAAGIGLALLSVSSPVESAWDLVLAASVPPAAA